MSQVAPVERFEKFIERIPFSGCWLWTGKINDSGYGVWRQTPTQNYQRAHRLFYKLLIGAIPDGVFVCHRCDVPCCVNPAHLFLGSQKDNMADAAAKGRTAKGMMHGQSKLNSEDVLKIRSSFETQEELALRFGVTRTTIGRIRNRKLWRDLSYPAHPRPTA